MKEKWIALAALAASFALLTGCGSDTASAKSASAASAAVSAAPAKSQNKSGESAVKKSEERIIRITAGSHVIHAKLYDNAAARALWDKMPVTYSMQNLYNREMCFRMGAGSLPTKEAKDTGYKGRGYFLLAADGKPCHPLQPERRSLRTAADRPHGRRHFILCQHGNDTDYFRKIRSII